MMCIKLANPPELNLEENSEKRTEEEFLHSRTG